MLVLQWVAGCMQAMILAAGRGERMGALTATTAKTLLNLNGESLIERQLRRMAAAGILDVVINLSYCGEQIRSTVGDGSRFDVRIRYSEEATGPLETAGGIIQALPMLGDAPFLVSNADVVSDFDFSDLGPLEDLGSLVLVPNPAHHPAGDYGIDDRLRLTLDAPEIYVLGHFAAVTSPFHRARTRATGLWGRSLGRRFQPASSRVCCIRASGSTSAPPSVWSWRERH